MKWGSTAASGSGLHAFQSSMSLEASSCKVHAHFSSLMHLLVPGAYRLPSLQTASQHRLLDGNRHRRSMHPDSPVNTASIRPHLCGISPLNGNAPPIAQTPSSAPTFDGATPKSTPLSELSQHLRVHSRLTAKPKQMRAFKTPTPHSRVRASRAGDSRGARATATHSAPGVGLLL